MQDHLILMGGLPRSGSTLLSALLNQNTDCYVTTVSPLVEILWSNYILWDKGNNVPEFNIRKMQDIKKPFLRNLQKSFHSEFTDRKYVFDKRRQWQNITNIRMFIDIYGYRPKIVCPVRDVPTIFTSFDRVLKDNDIDMKADTDKFHNFCYEDPIFGSTYSQLKEVYNSEYRDCLHLIEFEDLTRDTQNTLNKVYDYLGIERFSHDLDNIKALEDESDYTFKGLHTLLPSVTIREPDEERIREYTKFSSWNFWRE